MNINASIIDQRVVGIAEEHPEWLPEGNDLNMQKSAAFVLLCISTCLDIPLADAAEMITDGGNDAGVDGLHIGEVEDSDTALKECYDDRPISLQQLSATFRRGDLLEMLNFHE